MVLPFGNSDRLEVGDFVFAIGNPPPIGQTVSAGIVSGLHRANVGIGPYEDFIQTDAAIYPGQVTRHGEFGVFTIRYPNVTPGERRLKICRYNNHLKYLSGIRGRSRSSLRL